MLGNCLWTRYALFSSVRPLLGILKTDNVLHLTQFILLRGNKILRDTFTLKLCGVSDGDQLYLRVQDNWELEVPDLLTQDGTSFELRTPILGQSNSSRHDSLSVAAPSIQIQTSSSPGSPTKLLSPQREPASPKLKAGKRSAHAGVYHQRARTAPGKEPRSPVRRLPPSPAKTSHRRQISFSAFDHKSDDGEGDGDIFLDTTEILRDVCDLHEKTGGDNSSTLSDIVIEHLQKGNGWVEREGRKNIAISSARATEIRHMNIQVLEEPGHSSLNVETLLDRCRFLLEENHRLQYRIAKILAKLRTAIAGQEENRHWKEVADDMMSIVADREHEIKQMHLHQTEMAAEIFALRDYIAEHGEKMVPKKHTYNLGEMDDERLEKLEAEDEDLDGMGSGVPAVRRLFYSTVPFIDRDDRLTFRMRPIPEGEYANEIAKIMDSLKNIDTVSRERDLNSPRNSMMQLASKFEEFFETFGSSTSQLNANLSKSLASVLHVTKETVAIQRVTSGAQTDPWQPDPVAAAEAPKPKVTRRGIWAFIKKGRGKIMNMAILNKHLAQLIREKIELDEIDAREGNKRQKMSDFVFDAYMFKYGLKSLAVQRLLDLVTSIIYYREESMKIESFGKFLAAFDNEEWWDGPIVDFYMDSMSTILKKSSGMAQLSSVLTFDVEYRQYILHTAAIEVFPSLFPEIGMSERAALKKELDDLTTEKLAKLESEKSNIKKIDFDRFMAVIVKTWQQAAQKSDLRLRAIFLSADLDGNGVIDQGEFAAMVKMADSSKSKRQIDRMFHDALVSAGLDEDSDSLQPETFVAVAKEYGLVPTRDRSQPVDSVAAVGEFWENWKSECTDKLEELRQSDPETFETLEMRVYQLRKGVEEDSEVTGDFLWFVFKLLRTEWEEAFNERIKLNVSHQTTEEEGGSDDDA
jgi:hypothetical protein